MDRGERARRENAGARPAASAREPDNSERLRMKGRAAALGTAAVLLGVGVIFVIIAGPVIVEVWIAGYLDSKDPEVVCRVAEQLAVSGSARSLPHLSRALVRHRGPDRGHSGSSPPASDGPEAIDPEGPPSTTFLAVARSLEQVSARVRGGRSGDALLDFLRDEAWSEDQRASVFQSLRWSPADVFGPLLEEALVRRTRAPEEAEVLEWPPPSRQDSTFGGSWSFETDIRDVILAGNQSAGALRPAIEELFRRNDPKVATRRLMDIVQGLHDSPRTRPETQRMLMGFILEKVVTSETFSRGVDLDFLRHVVDMWTQTYQDSDREPFLQALLAVHDPVSGPSNSALLMLARSRWSDTGPEGAEAILERIIRAEPPAFWRRYAKSELLRLWLMRGIVRVEMDEFCEDLREALPEHRRRFGFDNSIRIYENTVRAPGRNR